MQNNGEGEDGWLKKNYFWVFVFQLTNHDHWEGEDGCLKQLFFLFVIQQTKDDHGKYLPRTREPIGAPRPLLKLNIKNHSLSLSLLDLFSQDKNIIHFHFPCWTCFHKIRISFTFFVGLVFTR